MKDSRGVERGACQKEKCPCDFYEVVEESKSWACNYCGCPPTFHSDIGDSAVKSVENASAGTNSTTTTSTPNSSVATSTPNSSFGGIGGITSTPTTETSNVVTLAVDNVADPFLQSLLIQTSTSNEPTTDEIFLPMKLPRKCEEALEKREVDHKVKANVVREVVSNLMGHDQTSTKCLEKAAKKMVKKWSPLKDPNDPNNDGLLCMLRKRRDRCNLGVDSSASTSTNEITSFEAKKQMYEKWTDNQRASTTHATLMALARPLRKVEAKKLPGLQLLKAYPALGLNDILLQEFFAEMEIDEDKARENWRKTMEPLKQYHKDEKKLPFVEGTLDEETLWILESMHLYNIWFKETNRQKRSAKVLELFPDNTPPAETQPNAKEAPRLIGIGSLDSGTLSMTGFIDSEPVFSEQNPFKAMLLLLALYFVVDLKWPPLLRLPLVFLTCAIGGLAKVRSDVVRNAKFVSFLRRMKAYE